MTMFRMWAAYFSTIFVLTEIESLEFTDALSCFDAHMCVIYTLMNPLLDTPVQLVVTAK